MNREQLLSLLETMWLIRAFEEKASELYARGKIKGLLHLGIGQEGVAAAIGSVLNTDDYTFGGHRAHAHAIAKGADPSKLMAELAGRATGYCSGKGGSMHISAPEVGFIKAQQGFFKWASTIPQHRALRYPFIGCLQIVEIYRFHFRFDDKPRNRI